MKVTNYIEHYEKDAELFDYFKGSNKIENDYSKRMHEAILSVINFSGKNILDIGSGSGWILNQTDNYKNITLVDLSIKNLSLIKNLAGKKPVNCVLADAADLPFKNNYFDFIVLSEVLEHLNEPQKTIQQIYNILKPGGKAVISTPNNEVIRYYLCIHCNKKTPANSHLHVFNEKIFSGMMKDLKIKQYKFITLGNNFFLKTRISYLFGLLPFTAWKIIDKFFNFIKNKPYTIIMIFEKP